MPRLPSFFLIVVPSAIMALLFLVAAPWIAQGQDSQVSLDEGTGQVSNELPAPGEGTGQMLDDLGDTQEGAVQVSLEEFIGIYAIDRIARNQQSCDLEGAVQVDMAEATHFVLFPGTLQGKTYLTLLTCSDPEACQEIVRTMPDTVRSAFTFWFEECVGAEIRGQAISAGFADAERTTCRRGSATRYLMRREGEGVRAESRLYYLADYPTNDRGHCTTPPDQVVAQDVPCTQLTSIVARWVAPL
ncbi:MAG: hypothetical protein JW797_20360 [Bradymonadales bacterium]|nr:hypothetical protein [Bradymonadales bacterium]